MKTKSSVLSISILLLLMVKAASAQPSSLNISQRQPAFYLDEDLVEKATTSAQWLPFVFCPTKPEKVFLKITKTLDSKTQRVIPVYSVPEIEIEFQSTSIPITETEITLNNPSTFTLFYDDGSGDGGTLCVDKIRLYKLLLAHFKNHPEHLGEDHLVKAFLGVDVYKLDCDKETFVKHKVVKSDYLVFKIEKNTVELMGFNFDSLSGESGGHVTLLKKAPSLPVKNAVAPEKDK